MELHFDENKLAFKILIDDLSEKHNIRNDILEKDYYVTLLLKELSVKQKEGLPAYFKGGTALYKALKSIRKINCDKKRRRKNKNRK